MCVLCIIYIVLRDIIVWSALLYVYIQRESWGEGLTLTLFILIGESKFFVWSVRKTDMLRVASKGLFQFFILAILIAFSSLYNFDMVRSKYYYVLY